MRRDEMTFAFVIKKTKCCPISVTDGVLTECQFAKKQICKRVSIQCIPTSVEQLSLIFNITDGRLVVKYRYDTTACLATLQQSQFLRLWCLNTCLDIMTQLRYWQQCKPELLGIWVWFIYLFIYFPNHMHNSLRQQRHVTQHAIKIIMAEAENEASGLNNNPRICHVNCNSLICQKMIF